MNPFSSSVTLDENRSVLPPLRERRPIYTYYDSTVKKDKAIEEADRQILLAWRRAWFAKGFRPLVLGPSEASNNQLHATFKDRAFKPELREDLMKWMAWGSMGDGVLTDWRCLPMAHYDDSLLSYLRGGTIPTHITRLKKLDLALFSGEQSQVNQVLKSAFQAAAEKEADNILDLIPSEAFKEEASTSIAYYDIPTIKSRYKAIADKLEESPAEGQHALAELINSHLQIIFQNTFSSGISVLKPYPDHTTALVNPALRLATLLAECTATLVPGSCPPNKPRCTPCKASRSMKISQPSGYNNVSADFTIGTLPHPYTLISLKKGADDITVPYIRRETDRDSWLMEATKPILGSDQDGTSRVVPFKDIVAGDFGMPRTLWFTVETLPAKPLEESLPSNLVDDLEWQFGFRIPRKTQAEEKGIAKSQEDSDPNHGRTQQEIDLLEKARDVLNSKDKNKKTIREVAEAWNLADTEVWRFVRAYE